MSNKLREQVSSEEIHEMRARLCLNIGLVYEWKNQLDQAEKYMEKALISSRYVHGHCIVLTANRWKRRIAMNTTSASIGVIASLQTSPFIIYPY